MRGGSKGGSSDESSIARYITQPLRNWSDSALPEHSTVLELSRTGSYSAILTQHDGMLREYSRIHFSIIGNDSTKPTHESTMIQRYYTSYKSRLSGRCVSQNKIFLSNTAIYSHTALKRKLTVLKDKAKGITF